MKTLVHYARFMAHLDEPQSQVTPQELACLVAHARAAQVIVELGTFEGRTSAELADRASGAVYSVDRFPAGRLGVCYGELIARDYARRRGLRNLHFIKGASHEVAPGFSRPVDLLFVDADHSFDGVQRDWHAWRPRLTAGAVAAFHDCRVAPNSPARMGSMDFYERRLVASPDLEEIARVDSMSVFRVR